MKSVFFYLIAFIFLTGCSVGEIEHRESVYCNNGKFPGDGAFLVNTSKSKRMKFIIKIYPNNQTNVVTNAEYILEPGAQTFLGCVTLEHNYAYEIVGAREIK